MFSSETKTIYISFLRKWRQHGPGGLRALYCWWRLCYWSTKRWPAKSFLVKRHRATNSWFKYGSKDSQHNNQSAFIPVQINQSACPFLTAYREILWSFGLVSMYSQRGGDALIVRFSFHVLLKGRVFVLKGSFDWFNCARHVQSGRGGTSVRAPPPGWTRCDWLFLDRKCHAETGTWPHPPCPNKGTWPSPPRRNVTLYI